MTVLLRKLRALEAAASMLAASLAIRMLPARHWLAPATPALRAEPSREAALAVRGAIRSALARLPFKPTCLAQSLAAAAMLRRRRLPHHLSIGARMTGRFEAHAWVEAAGVIVAGEGDLSGFAVLQMHAAP